LNPLSISKKTQTLSSIQATANNLATLTRGMRAPSTLTGRQISVDHIDKPVCFSYYPGKFPMAYR
jgi:hypothetical protein